MAEPKSAGLWANLVTGLFFFSLFFLDQQPSSSHSFGTPWASLGYSQAHTSCTAMFSCSGLHSTFGCSRPPHPPPGETPPPIHSEQTPLQLVGAPLRCPPHPYSINIC